jgi:hypothetical protein
MHEFSSLIDGSLLSPKLPRMPYVRSVSHRTFSLVCVAFVALGGCERSKPVVRTDTASIPPESAAVSATSATDASGWNRLAGAALLVQGDSRDEAIVLLPAEGDSTAALTLLESLRRQGAKVELFGRGGARAAAQLGGTPSSSDAECRVWPLRNVSTVSGDGAGSAWAVGFVGGQAVPLALDSVEMLTSRDSMALAAEASRLASAVTATTAPAFQGLRFTAHDIHRFEASPGVQAIVAHLFRKVNQEASPEEEQTLLIAERDSGVTSGPYQLAYAERTHGLEEEITTPEVIAGVRLGGRPILIVARDGNEGVAYAMLERTGPRRWRVRWLSATTSCG